MVLLQLLLWFLTIEKVIQKFSDPPTEVNNIEVAKFKILSLPWFHVLKDSFWRVSRLNCSVGVLSSKFIILNFVFQHLICTLNLW